MALAIPAGRIGVINTITHGHGLTSPKRAKDWVRTRRADWVAHNCIALRQSDPRIAAEQAAVLSDKELAIRSSTYGYDGVSRLMHPEELRNLPVAGQVMRCYW